MTPPRLLAATALTLTALVAHAAVIPLDSKATYLHTNETTVPPAPVALRLSDFGIAEGDRIRLEVLGDIDNGPGGDTFTFTLGLFSSSSTLLAPALLHRVPGALASDGAPVVTSRTFFGDQATDIPEDFGFDQPSGTIVTVPAGARFLFLAKSDELYQDNSDPDGDYGVRLTRLVIAVPEPASLAIVLLGTALLGLRRKPRASD